MRTPIAFCQSARAACFVGFVLLTLFAACGEVSTVGGALEAAGGAAGGPAAGGAGGLLSPSDNGTGGAAGALEASGGRSSGGAAGAALEATGGRGEGGGGMAGAGAETCVDANAPGFALNSTCSGGAPASKGCHASCEIAGQHFAGCVSGNAYATRCYPSCADCP